MKLKALTVMLALGALTGAAFAQSSGSQLRADVQKLKSDIKADVTNSDVTAQEVQALETAIDNIVSVAHKPDPATVQTLEALLKQIKASGTITSAEKRELKVDVAAVVASAGVPQSDVTALMQAMHAIWTSSNLTKAELQQLVADVVAIFNDLPSGTRNP